VWPVVVATGLPHNPRICAAAPLVHPAAQRATHRLYSMLRLLSSTLPVPAALHVRPDAAAECVTLLSFLQICLGVLLPALATAVSEACLFHDHQQQRLAAGLQPERGPAALLYHTVWRVTLGGSGPFVALFVWLLLAVGWDWAALACAHAGRSWLA